MYEPTVRKSDHDELLVGLREPFRASRPTRSECREGNDARRHDDESLDCRFPYLLSWLWLFVSIKEEHHPIPMSNDLRTAGYSGDDRIMPLFVILLVVSVCLFPIAWSVYR